MIVLKEPVSAVVLITPKLKSYRLNSWETDVVGLMVMFELIAWLIWLLKLPAVPEPNSIEFPVDCG